VTLGRRNPQVTREGQFEPTAEAGSVDDGGRGRGRRQPRKHLLTAVTEFGDRGFVEGGEFLEAGHVGAGEETAGPPGADDHAADVLARQAVERPRKVFEDLPGEDILPMPGYGEGQLHEPVVGPLDGQGLQIASARGHFGVVPSVSLAWMPKTASVSAVFRGRSGLRSALPGRKQLSW